MRPAAVDVVEAARTEAVATACLEEGRRVTEAAALAWVAQAAPEEGAAWAAGEEDEKATAIAATVVVAEVERLEVLRAAGSAKEAAVATVGSREA